MMFRANQDDNLSPGHDKEQAESYDLYAFAASSLLLFDTAILAMRSSMFNVCL